MTHQIARRAAVAVLSAAVAVTGLVATGGSASAATPTGSGHTGVVRVADRQDEDARRQWVLGQIQWAVEGHDQDARRQWVLDQIQWAAEGHDQDARRQWVLDQIQWAAEGHDQDARRQWVLGQIQWAAEHGLSA
ncbi:hypothetical protein [Streptomyces sp. NPDC003393]